MGAALGASRGARQKYEVKAPAGLRFEEDYDLQVRVLGTGASANVCEAICRCSGKRVAVKTLRKEGLSAKQKEDLKKEFEVLTALEHPNIVRLESVYESSEAVQIVMERLTGGELFDRVSGTGGLPEEEAAGVTAQLLRALTHLHARRVVHRDIKPDNVMYQEGCCTHVKLIDFGFATWLDQGEQLREVCGTILYVAPEVLANRGYDEKADLWSLGCLVYIMLTDTEVYGGSDADLLRKNLAGRVDYGPRFRSLSGGAQHFVRWLLTLEPGERPSAQQALAHHPWLQQQSPTEGEVGLAQAAKQPLRGMCCIRRSGEARLPGPQARGSAIV